MPDIFDEVNEDLRAERARALLQRYGVLLIILAVLVVVGVGGWQVWRARQAEARNAVASAFLTAAKAAAAPGGAGRTQALDVFTPMAADGPSGYRTLARLQAAAAKAGGGDLQGALALWDQVSADEQADLQLRHLADLLWVQHQVDSGEPALVEGRLAPLLAPNEPWRPLALESAALLKLRVGDRKGAVDALHQLMTLPSAPEGVRTRATGLLMQLGDVPDGESQG